MKTINTTSRILIGLVFIFSGFVKAIDPLGSTYKFIDYFNAFHIGFFESFAFPLAIILSSIELVLGISLLIGYRMKIASTILLLFMSFFTVLTFILALTNPVHDCGCFGDAIILTNWQTFGKNIFLMVFTLIIFINRSKFPQIRSKIIETTVIILFFIFSFFLSLNSYNHLPIIDFRPYSAGTHIPKAMNIPPDADQNIYETSLIYREISSGKEENFNLENYPSDTSKWTFVDAESILVSKGYEPPIHDFNIMSTSGLEITSDILEFEGYTFFLITHDITKADEDGLSDANRFYDLSQTLPDLNFFAITASSSSNIESKQKELNLHYDFCLADEITLKTIIRSSPGLVLLHHGTIIGKWHYNDFPETEDLSEYAHVFRDYPFCIGCDLNSINNNPLGSKEDVYETVLLYRNIISDSLAQFSLENYPADSPEWIFENSNSTRTQVGYERYLTRFDIQDFTSQSLSESIFFDPDFILLFFIKDIHNLPDEILKQTIQLGAMSPEYLSARTKVYGIISQEGDELLNVSDEFISSFDYLHLENSILGNMNFDNIMTVLMKDGLVIENYKDNETPSPDELNSIDYSYSLQKASEVFTPFILKNIKAKKDSLILISFSLGLFVFLSLLSLFFTRTKE